MGTVIAEGKETREFDGQTYVMERALVPDVALVKAWKADKSGNLVFRRTARNPSTRRRDGRQGDGGGGGATSSRSARSTPTACTCPASTCTASSSTPTPRSASRSAPCRQRRSLEMSWTQDQMRLRGARAGRRFHVNLGIGIPTLVANHVPADKEVWLQSENGMLGIGPSRPKTRSMPTSSTPVKQTVTTLPGSSIFGSHDSFAMIRAGKINLSILGAMQVSEHGDLANWMIPGKMVKGMGGAMDLVAGVKRVIVLMEHVAKKKDGTEDLKIIPKRTLLPLTGVGVVNRIITDLAVMDVTPEGFKLVELADGVTREQVQSKTGVTLL